MAVGVGRRRQAEKQIDLWQLQAKNASRPAPITNRQRWEWVNANKPEEEVKVLKKYLRDDEALRCLYKGDPLEKEQTPCPVDIQKEFIRIYGQLQKAQFEEDVVTCLEQAEAVAQLVYEWKENNHDH